MRTHPRSCLRAATIALALALLQSTACAHDGQTRRTTRVVNHPDGSRTTIVTEEITVTKNGRTTRTRRTTSTRTSGAGPDAPPTPPDGPDPRQPTTPGGIPPADPSSGGLVAPPVTPPDAPPVTPPVAPPATPPSNPIARAALEAHNRVRAQVGVPGLAWDEELVRLAQDWANRLCQGGRGFTGLEHRPQRFGAGENLWMGATTASEIYPVTEAVQSWAEERSFFDVRSGRCRGGVCGHYTQIVWRTTTHVGCAAATCPSDGWKATVWVCNYRPAGNIIDVRPY